jgi:DNA-binding response OmpR family regulator
MSDELIKQLKNYTILYVEDEDSLRISIANTLKYYFKDVYEASNGEDGLYSYFEYKPDIILSDIQMPNLNGINMIEKIRQNDMNTIMVITTAYSSEEYLLDLINLHINHYILKPINSKNLLNGILKAFGDKLQTNLTFSDDLYFDIKKYKLIYKLQEIDLRKREIEFIFLLYKNKNQIINYSLIEETLWKDKYMSISALKTFIKEFRKKLSFNMISNIHQIGYKLDIK